MKKIKEIRLTITYSVSLLEAEVSEEVFKELNTAFELGDEIEPDHFIYSNAVDWMHSNVKESDCLKWKAEIDDLHFPNNE